MPTVFIWRPEPFNARLFAAATPARAEWIGAARAKCASREVSASIKPVAADLVEASHPRALIEEKGSRPHVIEPNQKQALKLAGGGFASVVNHPGTRARPYLRPTLPLWGPLYRRNAATAIRGI